MRVILRLLGLLLLAGAFAGAVIDATRSFAAGRLVLTPLGEVVGKAAPEVAPHLREAVERAAPALWNSAFDTVLLLPGWAVLAAFGLALLLAGRPRPPLIGHSRR